MDHLANGVASTGIAVFNGETLLATGVSTTTCMPLPGKPKKETADKAQPHAQELLGGFAEYMTAPPEPYEGKVTWEL